MNHLLIQSDSSIKEALKQLSKGGEKCLIVVDSDKFFLGTISDGDVRRSILDGKKFDASIKTIFNKDATYVEKGRFSTYTKGPLRGRARDGISDLECGPIPAPGPSAMA